MGIVVNRVKIRQRIIGHTQVIMQVIAATDAALARDLPWADALALRMIQTHYANRMLGLLAGLPCELSNAVLAAGKEAGRMVMKFSLN